MDLHIVIALSVGAGVACLFLGLYHCFHDRGNRSPDDRLDVLVDRESRGVVREPNERGVESDHEGLFNVVVPTLSHSLQPRTGIEQKNLRLRLARAGFNGNHSVELFLGLKMICLIGGAIASLPIISVFCGASPTTLLCTAFWSCLLFYLPDVMLRWLAARRQEEIQFALPNAIDLLIVAIEVGQGLDAAIKRVTKELERGSHALSQEFAIYSLQLQMGRSRADALHDLGMRSGVPDMNSFATVLLQADRFGASIAKTMRQLSESARRKRRQRAEERAQQTAVKMIFPLVLFIFPGIFVVLVGPAMLLLWRDLSSMR